MKRPTANTHNVENLRAISITDFKRLNFLSPACNFKNINLSWSNKFDEIGNLITVNIDIARTKGLITLNYIFNKTQAIKYSIPIIAKPSNLKKGLIWFFICPKTNQQCRKLHFKDGYFLHRTAFENIFYKKQLESHKERNIRKFLNAIFDDEVSDKLDKKYFKCKYNDKPTKKFLRLIAKMEAKETVTDFSTFNI